LEHARIYQFGRDNSAKFYISSADLMTRNLNRRVEIACPVHQPHLCEHLRWILESQMRDTAKASTMLPDGSYCRKHSAVLFDSQDYFIHESPNLPEEEDTKSLGLLQWLKTLFSSK
jgi:polyphosphate kinase